MGAIFRFHRIRFHFKTAEAVFYPPGKAGNVVRGALGTILRELNCNSTCPGARICERRASCQYARIFEPVDWQDGPSGLQDPPRPFVLRASHLDGVTVRAGQSFHFDVHLFMTRERPPIATFVDAFSRLAETGLGPSRGRVRLEDTATELISIPLSNDFDSAIEERLRIRFVTATELKQNGRIAQRPDFQMIVARVTERLTNLSELYGEALAWNWRGLVAGAGEVKLVETQFDARSHQTMRYSTKTGQSHGVGGIKGSATYFGRVGLYLPMLEAAKYCGIGRHTVWGNGMLEVALVSEAAVPNDTING